MKTIFKNNLVSVQDRDPGEIPEPLDKGDTVERMALEIGAFSKAVSKSLPVESSKKEPVIRLKTAVSFLLLCMIQGLLELYDKKNEALLEGLVQKVGMAIYGDYFFKEDVPGTLEYFLCFFEKNYRLCCEAESLKSMVEDKDLVAPGTEALKAFTDWLSDVPELSAIGPSIERAVTTQWKEMDMAIRIKRFLGLTTL